MVLPTKSPPCLFCSVVQEYEGDSRLPADRQSTYAVDELHGRELTSTLDGRIMKVLCDV